MLINQQHLWLMKISWALHFMSFMCTNHELHEVKVHIMSSIKLHEWAHHQACWRFCFSWTMLSYSSYFMDNNEIVLPTTKEKIKMMKKINSSLFLTEGLIHFRKVNICISYVMNLIHIKRSTFSINYKNTCIKNIFGNNFHFLLWVYM